MTSSPQLDAWLARLRRFWFARIDALERYLDRMDDRMDRPARTNGKREEQ